MAERRSVKSKSAPLPEAARPSLTKPPRPGSREDREQIAANRRDQAYNQGERLRAPSTASSTVGMARRRAARAQRRVAERTRANALGTEAAIAVKEERPKKLKRARHVEQLTFLEGRGTVTLRQRAAGERLRRDFVNSGSLPRLTMLYEHFLRQAEIEDVLFREKG